jgi:hypothetical protein
MWAESSSERSLDGFHKGEAVNVLTIEMALELLLKIGQEIPDPPPPPRGARASPSGERAGPSV